jgi:hypothetical protein
LSGPIFGRTSSLVVAAVVDTVAVPVPLVADELSVMAELGAVQVGR